jgi:hypothetical protein
MVKKKKKDHYCRKKHLPTIRGVFTDMVWNEVKGYSTIQEKPYNTKGHPAVPFRQEVLDSIFCLY